MAVSVLFEQNAKICGGRIQSADIIKHSKRTFCAILTTHNSEQISYTCEEATVTVFAFLLNFIPCTLFVDRILDRYLTSDPVDNILLSRSSSQRISRRAGLTFYT